MAPQPEIVTEVNRLLRAGDVAGAHRSLGECEAAGGADRGAVLDCEARVAYLELDFDRGIDAWERAYAAYRAEGDDVGAVRVARMLGYMHGAVRGNGAVMSGWLARAQTLLRGVDECPERGWVALTIGMFDSDRAHKEQRFREALTLSRASGDHDLEFLTLAYLGASLVHDDRPEEGMLLLDEALAAVVGNDVGDVLVVEDIFCQLFSACEHAHDVARADQWMRVGEAIAAKRHMPALVAHCHTHYGGVLTAAGRWPEADTTLTEAVRLWGLGYGSLQAGALVRLADLRVRQGRFEEAKALLQGLEHHTEAARPLAAIHLAYGDAASAADILDHALAQLEPTSSAAAPLLALLVDVQLASGDVGCARDAADQLARCAAAHPTEYLKAHAALARGQICVVERNGDASACLRDAFAGFERARLPMESARARLAFANALAADRPDAAITEAKAALHAFEQLRAAREVDAAASVLRSLGARVPTTNAAAGVLSAREAEVLELLGYGLSNPQIAARLYISRKTVEHHVSNIMSKLDLRSRAEAAAYVARSKPANK